MLLSRHGSGSLIDDEGLQRIFQISSDGTASGFVGIQLNVESSFAPGLAIGGFNELTCNEWDDIRAGQIFLTCMREQGNLDRTDWIAVGEVILRPEPAPVVIITVVARLRMFLGYS